MITIMVLFIISVVLDIIDFNNRVKEYNNVCKLS